MRSVWCLWVRLCCCALAGELMVSIVPSCSDLGGWKRYQYSCQLLFLEVLFCLFTKILFSLNWSQCTGTRAESSHLVLPLKPWCASGCVSVTFLVAGYSIANNREAMKLFPLVIWRSLIQIEDNICFSVASSLTSKILISFCDPSVINGSCLEWRLSPAAFGTITV